ncbi:MAG TPA: hypothetical protein PL169_23500, partial [Leptospiraceae bacterium]|nr:hypothetical protein [Leptospiraceae bacterium]
RGGYLQFKQDYVFWTMLNAVKELKSLHDKETSDLSLRLHSVTESLRTATERLDTEKKKNDKLAEELASVRTHGYMSQQNLQRIIEKQEKLLAETDRRLRALETFQTAAAAANANAGKERK